MGREVRRVPAHWQHPRDDYGHYIPMEAHFCLTPKEIEEGVRNGWLQDSPPHYGCAIMPDFPAAERTHHQMYETTSEGTPISPILATPEALAQWLADHKASAFGPMTATYEEWLAMIHDGSAPSKGARDEQD